MKAYRISTIYSTFASEHEAQNIAQQLLQNRLIACANIMPIKSMYEWEKTICNDHEWAAIFKTSENKQQEVALYIEQAHSYKIPCILIGNKLCNQAYYEWILAQIH